jgi:type II secretory pathway component GspD/PulD (secretin)
MNHAKRFGFAVLLSALLWPVFSAPPLGAQTPVVDSPPPELRFAFDGVAWRDVIRWLADEADLALHVGDLPTGSFTYADNRAFTPDEAIDRVNLFLIPQGFALVRSGQLLSVINLADARSRQQLDAIATLVNVDELVNLKPQEVVKCIFPLGEIAAQDAVDELSVLNLMTTPEILERTNQLIIVDTASKLRNVKSILDAFQLDKLDNGTIVQNFALQHVDSEDVLLVARPHLGLATDEYIGIDVSVSSDPQGKNLFVTGVKDKVKLLEGLVNAIDRPKLDATATEGDVRLQAHLVEGGNVQMVYDVLQTLLAGRDVRLSMDETAGSVVALATASIQDEITRTVDLLRASQADFEVIQLRTADPYFVVSLLEEMLDLPDSFTDPDDIPPDTPKIDADPSSRRLFVRAKRAQVEQIKKIVAGLDGSAGNNASENDMRVLPLRGKEAERALEIASKFWQGENPIVLLRSLDDQEPAPTERVISEPNTRQPVSRRELSASESRTQRWLTSETSSTASAIRCQITARGLLIQSNDAEALNRFEQNLITIAGPGDATPSPPIVFYLKFIKAEDALRLLAELLDGGTTTALADSGTLVNGFVASTDSFLGTLISTRDGMLTLTEETMTVVADSRLNRLIAQGTESDIERIEQYLKIVDKDNSITAIETYGSSHVIELVHTRAAEVADALRQAFAGRVIESEPRASAQPGQPNGQRGAAAPQPRGDERGNDDRGDKGDDKSAARNAPAAGGRAGSVRDLEPKMTIAVHEPSNSLIVTGPDALCDEAEKLAKQIDSRGEQTVEVVTPASGAVFEAVLQQVLLGETSRTTNSTRRSSGTSSNTPSRPSPPSKD